MFLKTLEIVKDNVLLREIKFRKGINLIVDETDSAKKINSGNGVGKTTVLRLIDFCLDGNGENIYIDPEFRTHNDLVEQFLKENNVIIKLTMTEDIDKTNSHEVIIEKNFLKRKEKIQKINGEQLGKDEFSARLKALIFKTDIIQPTFKQLKAKNIRDEKHKLVNTLKILASNVVTDATYETLHLFWFGIDADISRDKLSRELTFEKKMQIRFRQSNTLSQINQALIIINRNISELERKKLKYNINENYQNDLNNLSEIKKQKNVLSTEISRLELRHELILESKSEFEKDIANIDTDIIKEVYLKAKAFIPDLQKTFEDVIEFHNSMLQKKATFIMNELPSIEAELSKRKLVMSNLINKEETLVDTINTSIQLEDLQEIIDNLNNFYEKRGILEEQRRNWETSNERIKRLEDELSLISDKISSKDEIIQSRITEFNAIFSDISNRLDGVHSLISADNSSGIYKFEITNVESNPGTGTKKSQMAAFDLAYIKYADTYKIPCLHFILQDQIENVHANQITNLLTEIVKEINCQYVLPVLHDKLPQNLDTSEFEVLRLAQTNKLFKI